MSLPLDEFPTDQLLGEVITRAQVAASVNSDNRAVGREFSLAATAAEEARWRFANGEQRKNTGRPVSTEIRERLTERRTPEGMKPIPETGAEAQYELISPLVAEERGYTRPGRTQQERGGFTYDFESQTYWATG